jgi:NAD-dependent SIR2 family protein deacetylase
VEPSNRQKKGGDDGAQSAGHRHVFHIHGAFLSAFLIKCQLDFARAPAVEDSVTAP